MVSAQMSAEPMCVTIHIAAVTSAPSPTSAFGDSNKVTPTVP